MHERVGGGCRTKSGLDDWTASLTVLMNLGHLGRVVHHIPSAVENDEPVDGHGSVRSCEGSGLGASITKASFDDVTTVIFTDSEYIH